MQIAFHNLSEINELPAEPKEREQARLPDPEPTRLTTVYYLQAFQAKLRTQLQSAPGREGGLAPALFGSKAGTLLKPFLF